MSSTVAFGFKGIPHISPRYKGDNYLAARSKMKKIFQQLGDVKKLYVNMDTGSGRVEIVSNDNLDLLNVVKMICNSPMRMIKFSWETPILEMKTEQDWLHPYKTWLFLDAEGTYEEIHSKSKKILDFQQMIHELEFQEREFEDQCEEWALQCELDEVLTSCYPEWDEEIILETNKRTHDMIIHFDTDNEDSEDEYDLIETFTPVCGKTDFTIQEICEHIRMLGATRGKMELSISELTQYFGQKREYKRVPKNNLDALFPKLSLK